MTEEINRGSRRVGSTVKRLQARLEQITYALLCVGPADLSITSRTQSIGRGRIPSPEEIAATEGWLQNELAVFAAREGLALLAKPEFVLDHNGHGIFTLTALAPTLRWDALRWPENPGQRGNQG